MLVPEDPILLEDYYTSAMSNQEGLKLKIDISSPAFKGEIVSKNFNVARGIHRVSAELFWLDSSSLDVIGKEFLNRYGLPPDTYQVTVQLWNADEVVFSYSQEYFSPSLLTFSDAQGRDSMLIRPNKRLEDRAFHIRLINDEFDTIISISNDPIFINSDWKKAGLYYNKKQLEDINLDDTNSVRDFRLFNDREVVTRELGNADKTSFPVKVKGLAIYLKGMFSNADFNNSGIRSPAYSINTAGSVDIGSVPFNMVYCGLNGFHEPVENILLSQNSYFNLAFDADEYYARKRVDIDTNLSLKLPGYDLNGIQINEIDEFTKTPSNLQLKGPELPTDSFNHFNSKIELKDSLPSIDSNITPIPNSFGKWHDLKTFVQGLMAPPGTNHGMDQLNSKGLKQFEFGNISPSRFGDSELFYSEIIGSKASYQLNQSTEVYALVGQSRNTPFLLNEPRGLVEVGSRLAIDKWSIGMISSNEVGTTFQVPLANNFSELEIDSTSKPPITSSIILSTGYRFHSLLEVKLGAIIPVPGSFRGFDVELMRKRLSLTGASKIFEYEVFLEQHSDTLYSVLDFSQTPGFLKNGAAITIQWLKGAITTKAGIESLTSNNDDESINQLGALYELTLAFPKWPQLIISYQPFSTGYRRTDFNSGSVIQVSNQSSQFLATTFYSKIIGNSMLDLNSIYLSMSNATIFRFYDDQIYSGTTRSLMSRAGIRNRIMSCSLTYQFQRQSNFANTQGRLESLFKTGKLFDVGAFASYGLNQENEVLTYGLLQKFNYSNFSISSELGVFTQTRSKPNPFMIITLGYQII